MFEFLAIIILIVTSFGIYGLLALSLNLQMGYAGQLNLGQVMFFAVGAFASGWLTVNLFGLLVPSSGGLFSSQATVARSVFGASHPVIELGVFLLAVLFATGVGAFIGYFIAIPVARIEQAYLAIILLALAEITQDIGITYEPLINGSFGIIGIPGPFDWIPNYDYVQILFAIVSLVTLGLVYFGLERLTNSPYGRLLRSTRDDELASQAIGKDTYRLKREVMTIGGGIAGMAGAFYVFYLETVQAESFDLTVTAFVFAIVLLGGLGSNRGVLVGALLLTTSSVLFTVMEGTALAHYVPFSLGYVHQMLIGVVLILVFALRPGGLIPEKPIKTPAWKLISDEPEKAS
ncbi:MAG: branched-chain amino acid ABC transporter permease [Thaumarchaeota archaeon]|nr:branched-chain amino acid ABC transporter permease [Nitrososphaerota archaeon]